MDEEIPVVVDGGVAYGRRISIGWAEWFEATWKKSVSWFLNMPLPLTLLAGVTLRCGHLNVISWEETSSPVGLSFPPVLVILVMDVNQLTFGEAQLVPVGGFVVIYGDHLTD